MPHERDVAVGITLTGKPLGKSYGDAIERAHILKKHLDSWRDGRGVERNLDQRPRFGTWHGSLSAISVRRLSNAWAGAVGLNTLPLCGGSKIDLLASQLVVYEAR